MTDVSICVCTCRRSSLSQTLDSLAAVELPSGLDIEIVVIDNDDESSARSIVEQYPDNAKVPVRYLHRPGRNISIARNEALCSSRGRFLAFIDDDELATAGWLTALLDAQATSRADIVLGPVAPLYPETAPEWMQRHMLHGTLPVWSEGKIRTGYSGNVLIDRESPALKDLEFDIAFGQSGGEDTVFFGLAHKAGASIAYAPDAQISEQVPDSRMSVEWLMRRKFRSGQTHAYVLSSVERLSIFRALPLAVFKTGYCALSTLASLPFRDRRNLSALRLVFHLGVVVGLFDRVPDTRDGLTRRTVAR